MDTQLTSRPVTVQDLGDAIELCFTNGWTDGLPVVPATAERIKAMLAAGGVEPGKQVAFIENRQVSITAEKVAINAVMAGCKPEYMPVVLAAVDALADPLYGYHGPATSTGGSAVFMVVNGPIARKLDINSGNNLFGPGSLDQSSLGHAGKYTFCIAENELDSPWLAFHTTRGFKPDQNAVTIFAAYAPHQYVNRLSANPEGVLDTACAHMRIAAGAGRQPQYAMVFAGEHQAIFRKAGWSREQVQRYVFEHSQSPIEELKRANVLPGPVEAGDDKKMFPVVETQQDLLVFAAGGLAGVQSCFIPGWGGKAGSQSVTKPIRAA